MVEDGKDVNRKWVSLFSFHPFDVPLDLLARQMTPALQRHGYIAVGHQEVDLDRLAAAARGGAAVDFADIELARLLELAVSLLTCGRSHERGP
jgi:N-acyl-D-aspartate/D-glutamate deacylase